MGITSLADTKCCVLLRLHSQCDVWKSLGGCGKHKNSVSRAGQESESFSLWESLVCAADLAEELRAHLAAQLHIAVR